MATDKIVDITKLGPQGYKELQAQNSNSNQSVNWMSALKMGVESMAPTKSLYDPISHAEADIDSGIDWGSSRWDKPTATEYEYQNLSDVRAENQSALAKIGNGIGKMGVLAATTFVDGVVGTFSGLMNVGVQAAQGNVNSWKEGWNAFIENPFSVAMNQINEEFEKILPNYYTQAELENPWYTQLGTANFWGDKFLKNLGFTIGAAYSGKVNAGMLSKAMGLKNVRDAFKGTVLTQSGKQLTKADDIYKAYLSGDAFMDGVKLTEDLGKAAKKLKNAEVKLKIIGGVSAAAGEGRIEAINGTQEWTKAHQQYVEDAYQQDMNSLNSDVAERFPNDFILSYDDNGNPVATPKSQEASDYLNSKVHELDVKRAMALDKIDNDRGGMMNRIFGLNVALLSATNMWTLGRFFSGGYTSARNAKDLVKGGLRDWIANKGAEVNKAEARKAVLKGLSNIPMEAQEEMTQAWIQETPGLKYGSELNNFYGRQIDPDAEEKTVDWLNSTYKGFQNTYGDINAWEEGFIGGLTGLLGVPSISFNRNAQGKVRPKIGLQGELWENIREARKISKDAQYFVNEINKRIQTPEFENYYKGAIAHGKFDDEMQRDADIGDAFSYKNNEHNQLVSDAMMFDKAGRLQDFLDMIEEAGTITLDDVKTIREQSVNKDTKKSIFDNKSDQEVVDYFAKEKESIKEKVNKYIEISNNLKTLYGENISQDVLDELTWRMTVIDDLENRGKSLSKEIKDLIKDKIPELGIDEVGRDYNQEIDELLGNYAKIEEALSADKNLIDDINAIIADRNAPIEEQRKRIADRIAETKKDLARETMAFGRKIRENRIKYKKSLDRLQKQRNKLVNKLEALEKEGDKISQLRLDEIADFEEYQLEREIFIEELEEQINETIESINSKGGQRQAQRVNSIVATLNSQIEGIRNDFNEIRDDINQVFDERLKQIQVNLWALQGIAGSRVIIDNRTKTGQIESAKAQNKRARAEFEESKREITGRLAALNDMLQARTSQLISPIDVKQASEKVIDLIKVIAYRSRFLNMYKDLSEHPEQFDSEIQKTVQEARDRYSEKQADKIFKKLGKDGGIKNIKELKAILEDEPKEVKDKVLKKLSESKEESVKKLGENLTKLEDEKGHYADYFNEKLSKENSSPELVSAMNIVKDALDESNSLEEAMKVIENALNTMPEEVGNILQEAIDKVAKGKKSSKILDDDTNKPKKPVKKKTEKSDKTGKSAFERGSFESEEEAAQSQRREKESEEESEEEEETTEPEKPERKKKESNREKAKRLKLRTAPKVERKKKKDEENAFTPEEKRSLSVAIENATTLDEIESILKELDGKSGKDVDELIDAVGVKMEELQKEVPSEDTEAAELIRKSIEEVGKGIKEALGNKEEIAHQNAISELSHNKASILDDIVQLELRGTAEEVLDQYIDIFKESDNKDKDYYIRTFEAAKKYSDTLERFKKINDKAQEILENTEDNTVSEDSEDVSDDIEKENDREAERQPTLRGILRSWVFTQYDFNYLKSSERKAVPFNSTLLMPLRRLGAFDFVDNGSLGVLFNDNEDIPIHFIVTEGNDATDDYILLAIEVTNETEKIAKSINPITAQDGKKYQVVGVMGFDRNDSASMDNYNQMISDFHEELDDVEDRFKVSEKTTRINHLYSGRMVKSDESNDVEFRSLKQVLNGETPHFGIYFSNTDFRTPTLGDDDIVVKLNPHNTNPREGSIWLMTREADGRWYPKSVKIKRFTASEFDIEENMNTPIMKRILDDLRVIADPKKSDYDRTIAKYDLEEVLYFPDGVPILFKDDIVSITGVRNNVGEGLSVEEKAMELAHALQDESLNLRFQMNMKKLEESDDKYIDFLLNSNIITTDLLIPHNVNASFDIYPIDSDGNIIEPTEDGEDKTGHTGSKKVNNSLARTTVYKDGEEYYISTKTDKVMYGDEEVDQETADEVRFINQINQGIVATVEGNNKLYLGAYTDGREFGVLNGHIVKGERLEELLDKAKNKNKRKRLTMPERKPSRKSKELGEPTDDDFIESLQEEGGKRKKKKSIFERLADNPDNEDVNDELGEEADDDFIDSLMNRDNDEEDEVEEAPRKRGSINPVIEKRASTVASPSKQSTKESLNDTLNRMARSAEESSTTIKSFVNSREGRLIMREFGFRNFEEFRAYCEGHPDKISSFDTVKSKEDFDALIDEVRCTMK